VKHYSGTRVAGEAIVTVDGQALDPRLDLCCHSPNGFEWGYAGSGPAQLALAILADHLGDPSEALAYYQDFKFAVVAGFRRDGWKLTSKEIQRSMDALKLAQAPTPTLSSIKEEWS
jgi:hypothetical protein